MSERIEAGSSNETLMNVPCFNAPSACGYPARGWKPLPTTSPVSCRTRTHPTAGFGKVWPFPKVACWTACRRYSLSVDVVAAFKEHFVGWNFRRPFCIQLPCCRVEKARAGRKIWNSIMVVNTSSDLLVSVKVMVLNGVNKFP